MAGISLFPPSFYQDTEYLAKLFVLGLAFDSAFSVSIAWVSMNFFHSPIFLRVAVEYETASAVKSSTGFIPLYVKGCSRPGRSCAVNAITREVAPGIRGCLLTLATTFHLFVLIFNHEISS